MIEVKYSESPKLHVEHRSTSFRLCSLTLQKYDISIILMCMVTETTIVCAESQLIC